MRATTFGTTPAAIRLVSILGETEDPQLTRRVSKFLTRVFNGFARLDDIEDEKWFQRFLLMWRQECDSQVDFGSTEINSFVKNLISTSYKRWLCLSQERQRDHLRERIANAARQRQKT